MTALESKVRRALAKEGQVLRKPRSEAGRQQMGEFFVVSEDNHLLATDCDLEALAGELGITV